jgi:hypothetical protein
MERLTIFNWFHQFHGLYHLPLTCIISGNTSETGKTGEKNVK